MRVLCHKVCSPGFSRQNACDFNWCVEPAKAGTTNPCSAITVLELMIVISIIAVLSVLAMPAIRGFTRSNTISSANRQLLDDFALARQRAINDRSIVHVIFVPPYDDLKTVKFMGSSERNMKVLTNILTGSQTRYALYAERSAGDQPGRHARRYLTGWRTLPEGIFIPEWQLMQLAKDPVAAPFPTVEGSTNDLPHISFDASGGSVWANGARKPEGEYLYLTRGSIMFQRDGSGAVAFFDARENPLGNSTNNFNRIHIDGLTGRTRVERPEIQ
jgi:type II secretory pathway pseudopilin PulG